MEEGAESWGGRKGIASWEVVGHWWFQKFVRCGISQMIFLSLFKKMKCTIRAGREPLNAKQ